MFDACEINVSQRVIKGHFYIISLIIMIINDIVIFFKVCSLGYE